MPIDYLEIIFRFVLFGLLIYKLAELIKAYAIPFLKEEIDLEHKEQTELFEKDKLLISTQHRIENQISTQKKTFSFLEKNTRAWQAMLLAGKDERECMARNTCAQLKDKRKTQQQSLALAKEGAAIIPEIFRQASIELAKNFDNEHGKQQLHSFITKLR